MRRALLLVLLIFAAPGMAKNTPERSHARSQKNLPRVNVIVPTPRPAFAPPQAPEPAMDLSHALPGNCRGTLPEKC